MKNNIYDTVFHIGTLSGCHQMPERSFFFRGKQFPVCARCTGALIGQLIGGVLYFFFKLPILWCLFFALLMFIDWLIQYLDILPSKNYRRLITGVLCGIGLVQIYFSAIDFIIRVFI